VAVTKICALGAASSIVTTLPLRKKNV